LLRGLVAWKGQRNVYHEKLNDFFAMGAVGESLQPTFLMPTRSRKLLATWEQFWGIQETDSLQGHICFAGGDLWTKGGSSPEQLRPRDFRLHQESAGKGAAQGGTDLGADVDLVGPGPAYERWQQTPAYQQWLKGRGITRSTK